MAKRCLSYFWQNFFLRVGNIVELLCRESLPTKKSIFLRRLTFSTLIDEGEAALAALKAAKGGKTRLFSDLTTLLQA